jgi:regulatory factor X 1/2/3
MNCDYQFYDQVVQRLITDILSPMAGKLFLVFSILFNIYLIKVNVTQSIRTFGKSVDGWLRQSLNNYSVRFKTIKLTIVNAFAMTLRRYTSLNHLAQAARSVLLNSTQVNQMLADLNKVDFHNIQVCFISFK